MNKKQNMLKVKKKDNVDWRHSSVFLLILDIFPTIFYCFCC